MFSLRAFRNTYQAQSGFAAVVASELMTHDTLEYLIEFPQVGPTITAYR